MKWIRVWVGLILLLGGVGCTEKRNEKNWVRLALYSDPASFDPRLVRCLKDLTIAKHLYEGLTRMNGAGKPEPALAKKIEISKDHLTYTFYLREAYWNTGEPITAHDFAKSWKEALDPKLGSDYAYMLYPIKNGKEVFQGASPEILGIAILDETTLQVTLERPLPYFLELTSFPTYFPVHEKAHNGPFQLKTYKPDQEILLEKNPTYWDREQVFLDGLAFSILSDSNTESALYYKNQLDWMGLPISQRIPTDLMDTLIAKGELSSYEIAGTLWVAFQTESSPFDSPLIRKAFSLAIDREAIVTHILRGSQTPARGLLPPSLSPHADSYFSNEDSLKAATLLQLGLEEKGWAKEDLPPITFSYPIVETDSKVAQLLQDQWRKVLGVEVSLEARERQLLQRQTKTGDFQIALGQWVADFHDPLAFLEIFASPIEENGINVTRWTNEKYQKVLTHSETLSNWEEREQQLLLAEKLLLEEVPIAPLYHYSFDYQKNPRLEGVVFSPLGTVDFKSATLR
ncbi:MAG: Oligopeptide-binding protein OppA [Chlamydiae bacterium]|nr:Oligopeptide-binding protein OppA [Chlamydiota bacterium]